MKKLLHILTLTLALNFLAIAGAAAFLFQSGALSRDKIASIKSLMYPPTTKPTGADLTSEDTKTQPDAATQPTIRLDQLLDRVSGRPATEQVEFIQRTFDARMAQLDRHAREVQAREEELAKAQKSLDQRLTEFAARQKKLDERERSLDKDAQDKGFADSLAVYDAMQPRQVKEIFAGLDDATAMRYLRAMEPSRAAKVLKEFKSPAETERAQRLIEMIRAAGGAAAPTTQPQAAAAAP